MLSMYETTCCCFIQNVQWNLSKVTTWETTYFVHFRQVVLYITLLKLLSKLTINISEVQDLTRRTQINIPEVQDLTRRTQINIPEVQDLTRRTQINIPEVQDLTRRTQINIPEVQDLTRRTQIVKLKANAN